MPFVRARFELFVSDVERSVTFYQDVLGFTAVRRAGGYIVLQEGGVLIGLESADALPVDHYIRRQSHFGEPRGLGVEIVLECEDIDGLYERVKTALPPDSAVIEPLRGQEWGRRDFRVIDPDGYYVRVTT